MSRSALRITGGRARGRVLREPVPSGVRPTSSRVREALFSLVGHDLSGRTFLDAYGGSGAIGLEAWSRGATVTVVERDRRVAGSITRRGSEVGAEWTVRTGDVVRLAPTLGAFDIVFLDPPYDIGPLPAIEVLAPHVRERLVVETDDRRELPDRIGPLGLEKVRKYGQTVLRVYEPVRGDAPPS